MISNPQPKILTLLIRYVIEKGIFKDWDKTFPILGLDRIYIEIVNIISSESSSVLFTIEMFSIHNHCTGILWLKEMLMLH